MRETRSAFWVVAIFFASWACGSCGNSSQGPLDGSGCVHTTDCPEGYVCRDGECVVRPTCTDLDEDGYCDQREGYDDCNDNRPDIHPGAVEGCDGADNDCDSQVDEDCPCEVGETQTCGTDVGACLKGTQGCQGGQWGPCEGGIEPLADEACGNDADDDCDGSVDDGCPCTGDASRPCGVAVGECTAGVQSCQDGAWSLCSGGAPPQDEVCADALDNDCDGATDDGCACAEASRPCGLTVGACHAGQQACEDGVWGECLGARWPEDETCDGRDNDCDMLTDEGCECLDGALRPCGSDLGDCRTGTETCAHGHWGACQGALDPVAELCDGRDNDCDGEGDEDFPELRTPCQAGEGLCARPGVFVCTEDRLGTRCSAVPGTGFDERCNGVDDDCDGQTDEDFPDTGEACAIGQGACFSTGVTVCGPGENIVCSAPQIPPAPELCNGLDDDCDNQTDENFPLGATCQAGQGECRADGIYRCSADGLGWECDATPGAPAAQEDCNGLDDDCDGLYDEDWVVDCSNQCGTGYHFCVHGAPGPCTAPQAQTEVCDYKDNDCDDQVDEGFANLGTACQAGSGACLSRGYYVCNASGGVSCSAVAGTPQAEGTVGTCEDGIDNDCDGGVDGNDDDCSGGCKDVSLRDLWSLQIVGLVLGAGLFRRRRDRVKGGAA